MTNQSATVPHKPVHQHADAPPPPTSEGDCCKGGPKGGSSCCKSSPAGEEMRANLTKPMTAEQIEAMPTLHMVMRYKRGIENIDQRVFQLNEPQIDQAFLPEAQVGRWPVRVLLGHIADAEIAATHRMRRIVAEDNPVVSPWDEDAFVDSGIYQNGVQNGGTGGEKEYAKDANADRSRVMHALGGYLAVIHTLRQWTGHWLLSLNDGQWQRTMMHQQRGAMTLRRYVALNVWHLEHHAGFLTKKLDRMGIESEERESAGGGCGSGSCGCKG